MDAALEGLALGMEGIRLSKIICIFVLAVRSMEI